MYLVNGGSIAAPRHAHVQACDDSWTAAGVSSIEGRGSIVVLTSIKYFAGRLTRLEAMAKTAAVVLQLADSYVTQLATCLPLQGRPILCLVSPRCQEQGIKHMRCACIELVLNSAGAQLSQSQSQCGKLGGAAYGAH
jgi:hypothetical protein